MEIKVCQSSKCNLRRQKLDLPEYSLLSAIEDRVGSNPITVTPSSCLGKCSLAPCVAVTHEEYEGHIGLEGMTDVEVGNSVFVNCLWEEDADRVWNSVANGVRELAEEEE